MNITNVSEKVFHLLSEGERFMKKGEPRNRWLVLPRRWSYLKWRSEEVDTQSGEVSLVENRVKQDKEQFVRVFDLGFILELSKGALRMLLFIMDHMDFHGKVEINRSAFTAETGISEHSMYKYLKELGIENGVGLIYRESQGVYFVNPSYMCRGHRHVATSHELAGSTEVKIRCTNQLEIPCNED